MVCDWYSSTSDIQGFVHDLLHGIKKIIGEGYIGFYLHGSLAMGGFNPKSSDIDILVVTKIPLAINTKRDLAKFILKNSSKPFPVEISFLNMQQLRNWQHPSPFDLHYSEAWRERYEKDLAEGTKQFINVHQITDPDLAAHITITNKRGINLDGAPIKDVFPTIPRSDYVSSILGDFNDCLENIEQNPVYCTLNLIRGYWYLKEGMIASKLEAGQWGLSNLPREFYSTIQKVTNSYISGSKPLDLDKEILQAFQDYIKRKVEALL